MTNSPFELDPEFEEGDEYDLIYPGRRVCKSKKQSVLCRAYTKIRQLFHRLCGTL